MGQLHDAAEKGDVAAINTLLQKRGLFGGAAFDVNSRSGKHGHTPLHKAAKSGQVEAVRALVAAGADVGAKDIWNGWTPLHWAADKGQVEAVRALVAAGADVGAKGVIGLTPLHCAAFEGHVEAVRALVSAGADVGAKTTVSLLGGDTPLHCAVLNGRVEAVRALVAAGADVGAKNNFGQTPLDLAETDVRKALSAPPQRPPPVPQPPASAPSARPPSAPPTAAPASTALALYTAGPVTLPSAGPLSSSQLTGVVAALAKAGLQTAVKVAGGVVTCNPVALVTAPVQLLQAVHGLMCQGGFCQQRLQRMKARFAAMEPALVHLGDKLRAPQSAAAPLSIVQSLCANLLLLAHVMAQVQELQSKLQTQGARMLQRTLELLKAGGCEQEVAALDLELRDALTQLSAVLSIAHFTEVADMMRAREELRVAEWQQQNQADRAHDLQQLEGLVVEAVGGVQALQQQLAEQRVVLDGQVVGLEQVAEWLQRMQAGNALIVGHLQQLSSKVDGIRDDMAGMHVDLGARVDSLHDDFGAKLEQLIRYMSAQGGGSISPSPSKGPAPAMVIERSRIVVAAGALAQGTSGGFGMVVKAVHDGGEVAVKVYNHRVLGEIDSEDAMEEALLLSKANHHNVVRCFGIVRDPDTPEGGSLHGSLVMEWVGGGNLYKWLQGRRSLGLRQRLQLAAQVAAGMRHLHERRLVHGDLKPQNVLLTVVAPGAELPQAKICDFGLAKHTSTSAQLNYTPKKAYTLAYASPERLTNWSRSPQDDVYAFGILLYFIATSRTPFSDIPADRLERAIEKGTRPDMAQWLNGQAASGAGREVAEAYCQLAQRCWAAEAGARPTFEAVLGDLSGMLGRLQGQE